MSDESTTADKESNEPSRPQTVSLTKVRSKNSSFDKDTSIGEAFFLKQNDESDENDDNLVPKVQDTNFHESLDDSNHKTTENGSNSPKPRPKTVRKHRTDGYQQRLVDLGAIGSNTLSQDQTLSPKPKSDKCYICGKEFLLSSLKIHEKQCAKKHEKDKHETKLSSKTSSVTRVGKKPQLEACYLCGKEFFIHSLGIHETQCIKNWKANKTPDAKDQTVSERTMAEKQCNDEPKKNVPVQKSTKKEVIKTQNDSPKPEKKSDSPGVRQKGLKTMPCYVCGVAFLPHSLKIHEKKCQKKAQSLDLDQRKSTVVEKDNALLNLVTAADKSTLEQTEESQNKTNPENINNSSNTFTPKKPKTIVCYICGQEFLKSSYAFHEKKCSTGVAENVEEKEALTYQSKANKDSPKNSQKPRTIVCYICGQEFLRSSYAFHEKKCAGKKVDESESQNEKTTSKLTGKEKQSSDMHTERPETPRRKPKTKTCYICGKEMLLSSLKVHEQQCQKKTDILKNINHQKPPAQKRQGGAAKPKTQVCYVCGETFLSSSIKVHEAQCEKRWSGKT